VTQNEPQDFRIEDRAARMQESPFFREVVLPIRSHLLHRRHHLAFISASI